MSEGPPERDVKDFKFHQLCKVRVSDPLEIRTDRSQWLAASHKFDLVFIGIKDGFKVFKLSDICRIDEENARDRSTHVVEDFPEWARANLSNPISHLCLSCDELTLAVVLKECGNLILCMYDVRQFAVKTNNPTVFARSRLNASPGASVQDIAWNPVDPALLAVCVSDSSVELVKVTDKIHTVGSLPVSSNACCFCWSPKGRQLVVARKDGTMTQFDQELKEKRNWPMPTILENPHQVVDVMWISTYVFLAAYLPANADSSEQPIVILTVSSKELSTSYVNFEDVCYGSGEDRKHKYFFTYLAKWEMVLLSSSNATETTVIAKHLDQTEGINQWEHWTLEDSGRAELPLTDSHQDSFPVGMTVSLACQTPIKLGENKTHPASPVILLLSTDGILVPYYLMYLSPKAVALTVPPEPLTLAAARTSTGTSDSSQSSAAGSNTGMPGSQFGLSKPVPLTSTLPTTGSSFQFVQKTSQAMPSMPGASLLGQSKASTLPTTGNSFQFVPKPAQPTTTPGPNLFTPVASQAANVPSSGSQKSFSFTPSGSGTFSSPAATKQPQTTTAASTGLTGKNLFAAPISGSSAFMSGTSGAAKTTVPSFGFSTGPAKSATSGFGFGTEPAKSTTSGFGFGTETTKASTTTGTTPLQVFTFAKKDTPDASAATTCTAASAGFTFTRTESPSTFGGFSRPTAGSGTQTSLTATTAGPSPVPVKPSPTTTASIEQPLVTSKVDESKTVELPTPTYPVSRPAPSVTQLPAYSVPRPTAQSSQPPAYPVSRPIAQSTPAASTGSAGGIAGVKRDIEEESGQLSPSPPVSLEKPWVNETVESTFTKSILEEMHHFEQELRELKSRAGSGRVQVGSREEMQDLRRTTMDMSKFCENVKETTREQSREVHDQKVLCLDLFAMTEECRVRQERNDDPQYHQLLRSRALDPASSEKLKQLQSQHQVLDQGLSEVEHILDQQWEEYQDKKKAVKGRLQAPTSDMIYRTVKSNHNLIQSQRTQLESLQEKLKNLQLYNRSSDWQNTSAYSPNISRSTDLTSLVNSLDQGTPRPLRTSSVINVSPEKKAQLREFLSHRAVPRIKSTKPVNLSMSRIVAAKGLREKLEEVRSRPSPRTPPGVDNDQTVPLQLISKPRTGQGFLKVPSPSSGLSKLGQDTQTDPLRGAPNAASVMKGRVEGGDSLESSTHSSSKGVSSEELTSAMLRAKEKMSSAFSGGGQRSDIEDISPAFTPELASDEQEGFTEEDEGGEYDEEEEEEEDEEEAGFGLEYSLDVNSTGMKAQEDREVDGTPVSSHIGAATNDKKTIVSKNLFAPPGSDASAPATQPSTSAGQTGFSGGFSFSTEKSGLAGKPLFGSAFATTKPPDEAPSSKDPAATTAETKGFTFGSKPPGEDKTGSMGFTFTTSKETSGTGGFKFGGESGIFSKPSESSKSPGSSFTAFGGGSFGGSSDTTSTTAASSTSISTATVTAALNSSLLQALTESSTSVTSASVTASAALGSSLLAALADASSPAPQEAAAALSSFSFKPGETPSPPSTNTGTSALVVSGSAVISSSDTTQTGTTTSVVVPASGVSDVAVTTGQSATSTEATKPGLFGTTTSAAGGFGQPAKFTGSPPGVTTAGATPTTTAPLFGSNTGVFGSSGPTSFGSLSTPATSTSATATTTASVVKTLFGEAPSTTATSAFGTTASTTASAFGTVTTTTSAGSTSIFGTASTTASAFGQPTSTASTSLFGGGTAATTTASSVFGATATGLFGSQAATTAGTTSAFGTSGADTVKSGFSFGQTSGGFGQSPGFGQTSFGGGGSGVFGSAGFGQTATTTNSSVFGQATTTTQSSEGGMFGGGGGGLFGGLGGKPSADKANKNVFGGGTFGTSSNPQNSGLFGSGSGSTAFGTTSTGGFGSSGGFSAGGSGVGSTGFGISQTQQSPPASGGFGAQPAFGGSPSFGSSTFGGAPAFGSPSGGFGTTPTMSGTSSTFGSVGGQQAGFASFASGNSPTFGNLAQSGQSSFGGLSQGGGGFGSSGGFGSPAPSGFGTQSGFGNQQSGGFGSSPQFTSYRG